MTKQLTTGLREKHALPYGVGHVAIIADHLGSGEPIFSVEIYDRRTQSVERVRCYSKLREAQRHVMDIHAGACHVLHLQHRPDPQDEDDDVVDVVAPGPLNSYDPKFDGPTDPHVDWTEGRSLADQVLAQDARMKAYQASDEGKARAKGWVTEAEMHGSGPGVVHPKGWWASDWADALKHPLWVDVSKLD